MKMFVRIILSVIFCFTCVRCQIPPGFICVPVGACPVAPGNIDVRIVPNTPNPCPPGQALCPTPTPPLPPPSPPPPPPPPPPVGTCGTRTVTNINPGPGFATPGSFPWQAFIVNQTGYAGSGALITPNMVLTAAHKVYSNAQTANQLGVYMGVYNSSMLGLRYAVAAVNVHPAFNPATLFNDIAILTLSAAMPPLPQQFVNTVCLPTQGQSFIGQNCWVSGWGQTAYYIDDAPTRLQKQVQVPIVDYNTCYASMSRVNLLGANVNMYLDPVGEICAGGQPELDACSQDGGSPLVCNNNNVFVVAGLVIWGKGCGQPGVYGVYVNVPNYITWIQSLINAASG